MDRQHLQIQQLDKKMQPFAIKPKTAKSNWIKSLRETLGMTLQQFGNKLHITRQSALNIEKRETDGTITLNALKEAAEALDMQLVYGFVPKDGTLDKLIDRRAKELARQIVLRTSTTMKLEDQGNSKKRLEQAIEERAAELKRDLPKILWD